MTTSDERLPVSSSQQRMWFLQQLELDCVAMNLVGGLRLTGALDPDAAARCLTAVVAAHESLRTTLPDDEEGPYARVHPAAPVPLPAVELSGLTTAEQERAVERELLDNAAAPFDLACGPLLRARLLRLDARRHVLALALHHAITDGWSWSVLATSFAEAWRDGRVATTGAIRYAQYAAWERGRADDPELARQLEHWRRVLAAPPAALRLPVDGRRSRDLAAPAGWCPVPWPNGFAVAVRAASRQERTTPFTVLLAGFAAVLARLSGQDDVLVATPVANRARAELDSVVGCFINTLPLRVIVDEDASFTALLRATRERVIDAQANAEVPFERVVAALDLQRGAVRSALFQSLLVMQNTPPWEAGDDEHRVEVVELPSPHTHYDLKLEVFGNDPALSARLVHATDVLGPPRARLLAGQLAAFLGRALMSPDAPINSLSLSGAGGLHDRPLPQEVP